MDAGHRMVTVNGIRYRIDDAQRLGLVADAQPADTDTANTHADASGTKSTDKPVRHKARRPARGAHGGNDTTG